MRRLLNRDEPGPASNTSDDWCVESKQDWFEQVVALVESNPSFEHKTLKDPSGCLKWLENFYQVLYTSTAGSSEYSAPCNIYYQDI